MTAVDEHQLSLLDAMLPATVRQPGCAVFVSKGMRHGRRPGGLEIVNPFAPGAGAVVATVLDT